MHFDQEMIAWAQPGRLWLGVTTLVGALHGWFAILQAWLLSSLIAGVFLGGQALAEAMPVLWGLLGVFLVRAGLSWAQETSGEVGAVRVKEGLRDRILANLFQRSPSLAPDQQTGEVTTTLLQAVEALDAYYSQYLPQVALAVLVPAGILVAVFRFDLLSGLVFCLTGPLIPVFMILIGKTAESATRRQFSALGRMSAIFLDTLQGLATLKQFNQSQAWVARIADVSEQYRDQTMQVLRLTFLSALALELAATLSTAVVAVEIGLRLLYNKIEFQPAFFVLLLAPEFYLPLRMLGQRFHAGAAGAAAAKRVQKALAPQEEITVIGPNRKAEPSARISSIRLEEVRFQYPGRSEPILAGLDLELHAGETVALVGESGVGKSTLLSLIMGFHRPQGGTIWVDGEDLAALDLQAWHKRVAWVPQQPYLFQGSLVENIRLGKPDAPQVEVEEAAQLAGLAGFIHSLPEGYQTRVGVQGAKLSGGQAQRLALARAFLVNAPVILLDEPSARLDPELEAGLVETIARLCAEKVALVIAHRVATLRQAHCVALLKDGRIVERGEMDKLLGLEGAFYQLMAQSRQTS